MNNPPNNDVTIDNYPKTPWLGIQIKDKPVQPISIANMTKPSYMVGDKVRLTASRILDIISITGGAARETLTINHCNIIIAPNSTFFVVQRDWHADRWIYTLSPYNRPDNLGQSGWSFGNVPEADIKPT